MIRTARNEAEAVSAAQRSVRPKRSEDAQMVAACPQTRESVQWACVRRPWHSLPGEAASGRRYGNLGSR